VLHYQDRKATDSILISGMLQTVPKVCFTYVQTAQDRLLQTVVEELFQTNAFDVEDSIVFK
jgi:hypothetical protein